MMWFVVCKLCLISFGNLWKQSDTVPVPQQRNKYTIVRQMMGFSTGVKT